MTLSSVDAAFARSLAMLPEMLRLLRPRLLRSTPESSHTVLAVQDEHACAAVATAKPAPVHSSFKAVVFEGAAGTTLGNVWRHVETNLEVQLPKRIRPAECWRCRQRRPAHCFPASRSAQPQHSMMLPITRHCMGAMRTRGCSLPWSPQAQTNSSQCKHRLVMATRAGLKGEETIGLPV